MRSLYSKEESQPIKTVKSITELLNSKTATLDDWYGYAQSIYQDINFTGADDSTPELEKKISQSLSIEQLTSSQLLDLYVAVDTVVDKKDTEDDGFQVTSWGYVTHILIQEELDRKLQQISPEQGFSENLASLLKTIKAIAVIKKRKPEELFSEHPRLNQFLDSIQQDISTYTKQPSIQNDPESLAFLQKEEDYLRGSDTTEEKLLRQCDMLTKLSSFKSLLSNYREYVTQTRSDYQAKKLDIIQTLEQVLNDKTLPASVKIRNMESIIQNPENTSVIAQDTWGEKLLSFLQDCVSIFFTRTQTQSEFYKAELLTLKQDGTQPSDHVAASSEPPSHKSSNS